MKKYLPNILKAIGTLLTIVFLVLIAFYLFNLFLGEDKLTSIFQSWAEDNIYLAAFLYIILTPLINIIPGISSMTTIVLANMLFNDKTIEGMLISFALSAVSVILTSSLMFILGKVGGKRLVEWIVGKEPAKKIEKYLTIGGKALIPMTYLLPLFPDDTISLIVGMSDMSFLYNFVCTLLFRNIGVLATCIICTDLFDYRSFSWWMYLIFFLASIIIFLILVYLSYLYFQHLRYKEEGPRYFLLRYLKSSTSYHIVKKEKISKKIREQYNLNKKYNSCYLASKRKKIHAIVIIKDGKVDYLNYDDKYTIYPLFKKILKDNSNLMCQSFKDENILINLGFKKEDDYLIFKGKDVC